MYNNEWQREGQQGYSSLYIYSVWKECPKKLEGNRLEIDK